MTTHTKFKLGISGVIIAILIAFLLLNAEPIQLNLIVGTVETSRAVLVIAVFLLGLVLGWLLQSFFRSRKSRSKKPPAES